jgi:hypothetical protein
MLNFSIFIIHKTLKKEEAYYPHLAKCYLIEGENRILLL